MRSSAPLTVVVPVFNEGSNLRRWWERMRPNLPAGTRVLVVYDFEGDDTLPVLASLRAEGAPLHSLANSRSGVLGAILTGLQAAECGPVLVSMADLSDDPASVPSMLSAYRDGADVVVASRFMRGGGLVGGPWLKGCLARWGGRSLHRLAGFPVADATNSFRLYDAERVRSLELGSNGGFEIGMEITIKAWQRGWRVVEVPTTWRSRERGTSRFRLVRWLPCYVRLWAQAMCFGLRRKGGRLWGELGAWGLQ